MFLLFLALVEFQFYKICFEFYFIKYELSITQVLVGINRRVQYLIPKSDHFK